jgi:hypothetical protein
VKRVVIVPISTDSSQASTEGTRSRRLGLSKKLLFSLLLAACLFFAWSAQFDRLAESYTERGIERTLITFAVVRGLNGVISVAQGTELAMSPAGVGLVLAPGQILDPINDLLERFSWVVLASGTSMGIQRLLLEMAQSVWISGAISLLVVLFLVLYWWPALAKVENDQLPTDAYDRRYALTRSVLLRSVLVLLFLRFSVPLVAVINHLLYEQFLQPVYTEMQSALEQSSSDIQQAQTLPADELPPATAADSSLLERAQQWFASSASQLDISQKLDSLRQSADEISQQVLNMIVVFVLQSLILPLLFLWALIRLLKLGFAQFTLKLV